MVSTTGLGQISIGECVTSCHPSYPGDGVDLPDAGDCLSPENVYWVGYAQHHPHHPQLLPIILST